MKRHTLYTFRLHLWGVVLVILGALLAGVLLVVGGCFVGEWRAEREAASPEGVAAAGGAPGVPGAPDVPGSPGAVPGGSLATGGPSLSAGGAGGDAVPGAPLVYTLRLDSFGTEAEAQALADQVTARGYPAAVVPDETSRGTPVFHVTVGSYGTQWEARGAARELNEREARRGWRAVVSAAPAPL